MFPKKITFLTTALILVSSVSSIQAMHCSTTNHRAATPSPVMAKNIVETAVATDDLSTLVTAVQAGDLVGTLTSPGPFTVFAPVNSAFAKLPAATLNDLLRPENKAALQSVLTYHVVPGKIMAQDITNNLMVTTAEGSAVTLSISNGSVHINDAKIIATDIQTSNGVVHLIDSVIMPPVSTTMEPAPTSSSFETVVDVALSSSDFSTLVSALQQAMLVEALQGNGPFTVFAPTNDAFERMPNIYKKKLMQNPALLKDILLAHVVSGKHDAQSVLSKRSVRTLNGFDIPVGMWRDNVFIGNTNIIQTDLMANNGVVHVIDNIIFPRELLYR